MYHPIFSHLRQIATHWYRVEVLMMLLVRLQVSCMNFCDQAASPSIGMPVSSKPPHDTAHKAATCQHQLRSLYGGSNGRSSLQTVGEFLASARRVWRTQPVAGPTAMKMEAL
jgi:hypothetical protein